jgi:hypothetical protein
VGGLPTNIPQDFKVPNGSTVYVKVPTGATYLILGANDNNFSDNRDLNGNYGVRLSPVPEPASIALFGCGLLMSGLRLRKRQTA